MSTATLEKPQAVGVSPALLKAINNGSPFGPLPENYPHLALLCKKGFVRHRDELLKFPRKGPGGKIETDAEGKPIMDTQQYRDWAIVSDAGNGHAKFCMILDFLEHRAMRNMFQAGLPQKIERINILNVAIGIEKRIKLSDGSLMEIDVGRLERMSWRAIKSYLAKEGVKGYMESKNGHDETELVADAFENGNVDSKRSFL